MNIQQEVWGVTPEGDPIIRYTMTNAHGESVVLTNYGGAIVGVNVKDSQGNIDDVALGYPKWQDYISDGPAMGKSVGRFANRIAKGKFTLNDKEYRLAINNGPNALHGGPSGFHNRVWGARVEGDRVVFSYQSADGEEGYPGDLSVEVCYDWDDDANLELTYFGRSEADTIINLTNHIYFNLDGHAKGSVKGHKMQLNAAKWLPTDETQIPTGEFADVAGTPMDFIEPTVIGSRMDEEFEALKIGKGYDHCWVIDGFESGLELREAAKLFAETSGRVLTVKTTQPGIQIYTGNWLSGCPIGKDENEYVDYDGVAMECQAFPDSPNKPQFPSVKLEAGEVYKHSIIYSFSTL